MSKILKRLAKWKNATQPVPKESVLAILDRFLPDNYEMKEGSRIIVRHPQLIGVGDCGSQGEFTIAVKSGRTVKPLYLKRLVEVIEYLYDIDVLKVQEED